MNHHLPKFISNLETHTAQTNAKRNLILSILKSTTTKREAKNYLYKYHNQFSFDQDLSTTKDLQRNLFINKYLEGKNPFVNLYNEENQPLEKIPLRLAIIKLKFTTIKTKYWPGIKDTFKRLIDLGINPVVVMDYDYELMNNFKLNERVLINHGNKLLRYLNDDQLNSRLIRSVFTKKDKSLNLNSLEEVIIPLYQNFVPILQPLVFNSVSGIQEVANSSDIIHNLCQGLLKTPQNLLTVEKVIMVEEKGGIPSVERNQTSHVFINLSQEYSDIVSELYIGFLHPSVRDLHIKNLGSMHLILSLINSQTHNDDTTGIITTPSIMALNNDKLNPILYNVLTDRPIISSSLPLSFKRTPQLSTSIIKKGIPVQVYDSTNYCKKFTLNNLFLDTIDKERFLSLIEDSFGKPLNRKDYIDRINDALASVIILGDYDGAAIITYETVNDRKIAYLDKFAIAKKNQGLSGLADIIFKLLVQNHSQELVWRSRKLNPINKWYFERSRGSFVNGESQWKIFYTGDIFDVALSGKGVDMDEKLKEYSEICRRVVPSFREGS